MPPAKRPRPLIKVVSATLACDQHMYLHNIQLVTHGKRAPSLAAVWYQSAKVMTVVSVYGVSQPDPYDVKAWHTVIDIVQRRVGVVRVIDNEWASKTVAVLSGQVAMIPESTGLVHCGEVIEERIARGNRTLVDKGRTVSPVGTLLEEAMPML